MFQLHEATSIALHSVVYIANHGKDRYCTLKEISDFFGISANHCSKVLQRLVKFKILTSVKGPSGGFALVRRDFSLMEVHDVMEGKFERIYCMRDGNDSCPTGALFDQISDIFEDYMNGHKICDFPDKNS